MGAIRRLGGMITAPRATLRAIATSTAGDALEPILLWIAVVLLLRAHEAYRLLSLFAQGPSTILRRLMDLVVDDGRNDALLLVGVAVGLGVFGAYVAKRRVSFGAAATAAAYLLVPLVALKVVGGLIQLAGRDLWWMPHWPVDALQAIVVQNKVDWTRFAVKCVVAYAIPLALLLDLVVYLMRPAPLAAVADAPPVGRVRVGVGALAGLVALLVVGTAADVVAKRDKLKPATPGAALPKASLPWLTARPGDPKGRLDTTTLQGKVVLLDFWASWCAPCRRSIPELSRLHDELKDRGFVVLGVNREPYDLAAAKKAVVDMNPSFHSVVDDRGWGERLGVTSLPTSYLVDRQGVVRAMHMGWTDPSIVRAEVVRALEAP